MHLMYRVSYPSFPSSFDHPNAILGSEQIRAIHEAVFTANSAAFCYLLLLQPKHALTIVSSGSLSCPSKKSGISFIP